MSMLYSLSFKKICENKKRKLDIKSMNQNKWINEGVVLVNQKQSQGGLMIKNWKKYHK